MKAWTDFSEGFATKQKIKKESPIADDILAGINDPTIRALVGITLAENKKLWNENALLKHQTTLTIDIRDMRLQQRESLPSGSTEVLAAKVEGLLPTEINALEHAVSEEFLSHQDWIPDTQGRVKMKGMLLYKAGYVTAIKKILSST